MLSSGLRGRSGFPHNILFSAVIWEATVGDPLAKRHRWLRAKRHRFCVMSASSELWSVKAQIPVDHQQSTLEKGVRWWICVHFHFSVRGCSKVVQCGEFLVCVRRTDLL